MKKNRIFKGITIISFYIGVNIIGIPELFELCKMANYKIQSY